MTLRFSEAFHCLQTLQGAQPYRARLIHHSAHYNHEHDDAGECWNVLVRAAIKHSPLLNSVLLSTQSSSQLSPPLSLFIHTRVPCSLSCTFSTTTVSYPSLSCLVLQSVNVQPCLLFNRLWASTPALERIASTGNHPKCNCSSQQSRHH